MLILGFATPSVVTHSDSIVAKQLIQSIHIGVRLELQPQSVRNWY